MALKCNGVALSDEEVRKYLNTKVNTLTFLANYFSSYGNYELKDINAFLMVMKAEETPANILAQLVNYDVLIKVRNYSTSQDYSIDTPDNFLCGRFNPYQYLFDATIPKLQKAVKRKMTMQEELDEFVTSDSKVNEVNQPKRKYSIFDYIRSLFVKV